jgi:hypothetical protein
MKLIDLDEAHRKLFSECLEDWSADVKEAGDRRARWVSRFLEAGYEPSSPSRTTAAPAG